MELKLYELAPAIRELLEQEEWDEDAIDFLQMEFTHKADAIVSMSESMQVFADYCKAEEQRIAAKRKAVENRIASMLDYLKRCMIEAEMAELPLGTKTAKLQKNPPRVVVDNEEDIEARFFSIQVVKTLNKKELSDHLKRLADERCPGAHLEHDLSLRIK